MLYKAVAIALSTLFIATIQISAADARCGGGHGYKSSLKQAQARKAAKARFAAAKQRKAPAVQQASAKKAPKAEEPKVAEADPKPAAEEKVAEKADSTESEVTVAATGETCTKFFAETGTTVTVECTKE